MYRITLEHVLGIRREGKCLRIDPCIPTHWKSFDVTIKFGESVYEVRVVNPRGVSRGVQLIHVDGRGVPEHQIALEAGRHVIDVQLG